jgi:hypothetical protein
VFLIPTYIVLLPLKCNNQAKIIISWYLKSISKIRLKKPSCIRNPTLKSGIDIGQGINKMFEDVTKRINIALE